GRDRDGPGDRGARSRIDRRARSRELAVAGPDLRPVRGAPGRGDRTARRAARRGTRIRDPSSLDLAGHAGRRVLRLHRKGAPGRDGGVSGAVETAGRAREIGERATTGISRGPRLALLGILAICQRAYLTLWRQPVLIISTMLFPVIYLAVLGNALNRQLENVPIAVVDEAGNSLAAECRRAVLALESGRNLVVATFPADREQALAD